jgi:ribosome biogenesis GTPase
LEGIIIKGYGGFYYVWDGNDTWECLLRGKHRLKKQSFLPGDRVTYSVIDPQQKKAVIEKALPRRNELTRPAVANVEAAVLVASFKDPEPDFWLLDRLLILAQASSINPVICFNKADLVTPAHCKEIKERYKKAGFPVLITSNRHGWGIEELGKALAGKVSVLAGPSGVGKSSLLNSLNPGLRLKTGEISLKLGRGKHTTRHVELIPVPGSGFVADTPGFSQVQLPQSMKREELVEYYPDFLEYRPLCRFNTCCHLEEPQCAVKEAAEKGLIDKKRYERYRVFLEEVISGERRH